jgi:hypothetical protein
VHGALEGPQGAIEDAGEVAVEVVGVGEEHLGGGLGVVAEDVDLGDLDLGGDVGGGEHGPLVLGALSMLQKLGKSRRK